MSLTRTVTANVAIRDRHTTVWGEWVTHLLKYGDGKKRPSWADNPLPHNGKHSVAFWDGHVAQTNFDEIIERGWQWEDWRK